VSTPEVGSCFSFELPLSVPSLSDVDSAQKAGITLSSALSSVGLQLADMRILVVEDNFFNQQIVKEILQLSGVNVELANNGLEALAILAEKTFDAVLMDIHMPVMDGFEATQHIRKLPEFAELPVLALTAGVTEEEYEQCKACGMTDFVSKPIERAKLLSTLAKWVKPRNTGL
jgi:CheY-like chemotaxis protein